MSDPILPTPAEMIAHLDKFVLGQSRAKQDIAVAVYNHYLSQAYRDVEGVDLGQHHILLIGPTGAGKTYIVRKLAEFLGVPVGFSSAAGLVEAGYVGNSVETVISAVLDRAGGDPRTAEHGIAFIDEVDKVRRAAGIRDISGEGVQNALLTLLDGRLSKGTDRNEHQAIDTSRILFVCTGAFVGLDDIVEKRLGLGNSQIGFLGRSNENITGIHDRRKYELLCQVQPTDLVDFGFIPEFIGRFATVSTLHELSFDDLKQITNGTIDRSPLEIQKKLAEIHGIKLVVTDDALDAIAEEAAEMGTGARGLHRLIGRAVNAVDHRWPELASQGVTRVVIDRACVLGSAPPRLSKAKPRNGTRLPRRDAELRRHALGGISRPSRSRMSDPFSGNPLGRTSDTRHWSEDDIREQLEAVKAKSLEWKKTRGSTRKWWQAFEQENKHQLGLVLNLAEELRNRNATIRELHRAYIHSDTDNIQANLYFLDYTRLKKEEERKRRLSEDDE